MTNCIGKKFKSLRETIKINMLRALMEKADSMKEQRIDVAGKQKKF